MAKFVFTGDPRAPRQDPATCKSLGLTFSLNGDPVEAPNDEVADKLRRHSHFTEVGDQAPDMTALDIGGGVFIAETAKPERKKPGPKPKVKTEEPVA